MRPSKCIPLALYSLTFFMGHLPVPFAQAWAAEFPQSEILKAWEEAQLEFTRHYMCGRFREAEAVAHRMMRVAEALGSDDAEKNVLALGYKAWALFHLGQLKEAEKLFLEAEELAKRYAISTQEDPSFGDLWVLGKSLMTELYLALGEYGLAERHGREAVTAAERSPNRGGYLSRWAAAALADVYLAQARVSEAEFLLRRAYELWSELWSQELERNSDRNSRLEKLSELLADEPDRAAELRLMDVYSRATERWHAQRDVQRLLPGLAAVYIRRGRFKDAEELFAAFRTPEVIRRELEEGYKEFEAALRREEEKLGGQKESLQKLREAAEEGRREWQFLAGYNPEEDPAFIGTGDVLIEVYLRSGQLGRAEQELKRSLELKRRILPEDHFWLGDGLRGLGAVCLLQGRYAEAEEYLAQALAIHRKVFPEHSSRIAEDFYAFGRLHYLRRQLGEAKDWLSRAIGSYSAIGHAGDALLECYYLRARCRWESGSREGALEDIREAMRVAEQLRGSAGGTEEESAWMFGQYADVFEQMVAWQSELGGKPAAFEAMERARARVLMDQMRAAGVDPYAGMPEDEARMLREREGEAAREVASLQAQARLGAGDRGRLERLQGELNKARQRYAEVLALVRNASPAYRQIVGRDLRPVSLEQVQNWTDHQRALVVEYLLGAKESYVLIVPAGGEVHLEKLIVSAQDAQLLGIEAGELNRERLRRALSSEAGHGVLRLLRRPGAGRELVQRLEALARILLPKPEREGLLRGDYRLLAVVPDGLLAMLPYEALVIRANGQKADFLVDKGPPVLYAPSATILLNLSERAPVRSEGGREPVLLIGDCNYGGEGAAGEEGALLAAVRGVYRTVGGRLGAIPHTATEVTWLSRVFQEGGQEVAWLRREWATEWNVRGNVAGRRVVHFATHGFFDNGWGNLFGALALTPGPEKDRLENDGFLTLGEVYGLDLKSCELVVLSACETNVGPEQRGEGVHGLARGFLIAGARRVVASNWQVADEATANLMTIFATYVAQDQRAGRQPDYAAALQKAKRWMRTQKEHPEWQQPYYWAPFVLIGPK
ncbi:MAG: CHAT domain-containing protein [Candidatus Methanomethyliaceae archaeon]